MTFSIYGKLKIVGILWHSQYDGKVIQNSMVWQPHQPHVNQQWFMPKNPSKNPWWFPHLISESDPSTFVVFHIIFDVYWRVNPGWSWRVTGWSWGNLAPVEVWKPQHLQCFAPVLPHFWTEISENSCCRLMSWFEWEMIYKLISGKPQFKPNWGFSRTNDLKSP